MTMHAAAVAKMQPARQTPPEVGELVTKYQAYMQRISNMIYNNQLNEVRLRPRWCKNLIINFHLQVHTSVEEFWSSIPSKYNYILDHGDLIHQIEVYDTLFYSVSSFDDIS